MAQLKVKQISDFVSAVAAVHNGAIGTDTVTGISVAKSEAISSSVSADVVILSSAKSYADIAEADAISAAGTAAVNYADGLAGNYDAAGAAAAAAGVAGPLHRTWRSGQAARAVRPRRRRDRARAPAPAGQQDGQEGDRAQHGRDRGNDCPVALGLLPGILDLQRPCSNRRRQSPDCIQSEAECRVLEAFEELSR